MTMRNSGTASFSRMMPFNRSMFGVADSMLTQARWREWIDDFAVKWAPSLSYSKAVAFRRGRLARYLNVFSLIASGDANAAHTAFVNAEPGSR